MSQLTWDFKKFEELSADALYKILKLRSEIFVVEQNCVYLDMDDKDQQSFHLCGWIDEKLLAYARILPPGIAFTEPSIGRVSTHPSFRKNGAGKLLMRQAIEKTYAQFLSNSIKIGAQLYLQAFYANLGFTQTSEPYLEDGIPHIEMLHSK
ncbi:MAG: GNAT family N-acetyltransferase [Ferruginibacter sp.]